MDHLDWKYTAEARARTVSEGRVILLTDSFSRPPVLLFTQACRALSVFALPKVP